MQEKILQNFAFFIFWFWLIFLGHKKCRPGENLTAGTSCFFNDIILVRDNDTKLSEPGHSLGNTRHINIFKQLGWQTAPGGALIDLYISSFTLSQAR